MSIVEKPELLKAIGRKIKEVRISKNTTQLELAVKMVENVGKIDETNISRIESGRTNPTVFTLHRIAEALEVKIMDLVAID
ncbi:MAG: helix-turn-helix domain-containing protein [Flavobacteriaceae bacterium]|jgi:transcriptional regulator with XRE-family HTH domain|nr:helix-turn-helix domain-containing protein [Flavobacteriaceae bacterium]